MMIYSDFIEDVQKMEIMNARYKELSETIDGLQYSSIPLVTYDGTNVGPSGCGDDIGAYYFIPKLSIIFNLGLDQSITLFYTSMIGLSFIIGVIGLWKYCKTATGRWCGLFAMLLLSIIFVSNGDIYVTFGCTAMVLIPWCLYLQKLNSFYISLIYCIIAGFIIGISNFIRAYSSLSAALFIIVLFVLNRHYIKKQKVIILSALFIGVMTVQLYSSYLVQRRNDYLVDNNGYDFILGSHALWHNIYIGLGFLNNDYNIKYKDYTGGDKVYSTSPNAVFGSQEWNTILKQEVFQIIEDDPVFVIKQVFAKLGVCFMYILVFANIGIIFAVIYPKGWKIECVFAFCIIINALPGILVMPRFSYLLGLIALAAIYSVVSIDHGLIIRQIRSQ